MLKNYVNKSKRVQKPLTKTLLAGALVLGGMSVAMANGAGNGEEPLEYLIKFDIEGHPNPAGDGSFIIGGPGYSTITTSSGEILDDIVPGLKKAQLTGAVISFAGSFNDPIIPFTCQESSCTIEIGGSTLTSSAGVALDGRLIPMWGPIMNSDFNPDGSSTPLRILGCGGLKDVSGVGEFAGMVGSICFNGVFNLPNLNDPNTVPVLTGGSNCTITMHTPVVPIP